MASRTPSRRRAGGRSSSSQNSNQMPMILGGVGVLVLIIILVANSGGGGGDEEGGNDDNQQTQQPAKQPEPAKVNVPAGTAKAGATPDRPAPPLTQDLLGKVTELYQQARALSDEGIKLTKSGEREQGVAKQMAAKVKIDQLKAMIDDQLTWQEEAEMGDWQQPAAYGSLTRLYAKISKTQKTIRMNGGK